MWPFYVQLWHTQDFPGGSDGKASASNAGAPGLIPGLGRSTEKEMATHSSILASHGRRSLVGFSPRDRKESDMTEQLHFSSFHKTATPGTSLVVQWLRIHSPNAGGPGPIPGQGTRTQMLQLRVCKPQRRPRAAK